MESYIAEINYDNMAKIEQAYWDLFKPELQCADDFRTPNMASLWAGSFVPIICEDEGEIVGVMCIKPETGGIYYPVMKGDYVAVLASMVDCAQDNFDTLTAHTENEFIHELAVSIERPMEFDGYTLNWSK